MIYHVCITRCNVVAQTEASAGIFNVTRHIQSFGCVRTETSPRRLMDNYSVPPTLATGLGFIPLVLIKRKLFAEVLSFKAFDHHPDECQSSHPTQNISSYQKSQDGGTLPKGEFFVILGL
jgi:hypothetical protein